MKKQLLNIFSLLLVSGMSFGQQGDGGSPKSTALNVPMSQIDTRLFAQPNVETLRAEDAEVDAAKTGPWRFGFNNEVALNMSNSGTWSELSNGGQLWQLAVTCDQALTVNLTFDNVEIPTGNELYVYNPEKDFILGAFTSKHLYEGQLGTELVPGNTVIVEYYVAPENKEAKKSAQITTITHGYRTASEFQTKAFGSSGACNMNANCPDGDPWDLQRRAAVMLVSGGNGFCSGSMINNSLNDGTPYVLTANHCGSNPTNWVFRFNWQADGCTNPGSSPSFNSLSGAVSRAKRTPSDFHLVEITGGLENGTVPLSYGTYFPGWDNSDNIPTSTMCVHHPSGDIKKLAFDDDPAISADEMWGGDPDSQWEVVWDRNTTTEGGSSGSPLFDQNGRIIGQLWGGGASCSQLTSPDFYGKVSHSWNPVGSNSTNQLKYWLDPNDDGLVTLDGYSQTANIAEKSTFDFNLYPNPNNGVFTIQLDASFSSATHLLVTDISGRIVHTSEHLGNSLTLNLGDVSNGTYLVQINANGTTVTKRISVQK